MIYSVFITLSLEITSGRLRVPKLSKKRLTDLAMLKNLLQRKTFTMKLKVYVSKRKYV